MVQATDIDLWSPDSFVDGIPHDWFRWLREHDPVFWHAEPPESGPGFWAVTRYREVQQVSRDPATFSAWRQGVFLPDPDDVSLAQIRLLMLNMDPPQHTKLRLLVNKGFTPRMVGRLEPHVREMTNRIIDGFIADGRCEFVGRCAAELPLLVIAELLGVPAGDRAQLFEWSNKLIGADDPDYRASPADAELVTIEMFTYLHQLAEARQGTAARDDIVGTLLTAEIAGEKLTEADIDMFFMLLVVAGNETTRNMITHGLLALIEHPDQMARLRAHPGLLDSAIEEILRWSPPVMQFRRTTTRDLELGGKRIAEGQKLIMYYGSANRDASVFPDPDVFDIGRTPNDHVSFGGGGPHFCLGANLARLELRVMFSELLRRLDHIELAGPARRLRSNFINGIKDMPIRFTPVG